MFERELSILKKFVSIGSQPTPETFPELPECLIWMRFGLAVMFSVFYFGYRDTENFVGGALPLVMALNIVGFIPLLYCRLILVANTDAYDSKLIFDGLLNAMALILLLWIYIYTQVRTSYPKTVEFGS